MNKDRSRQRLREAVYAGLIKKPSRCSDCKREFPSKQIHGHHHKGYDRWWDVVWLCMKCHDAAEPNAKANIGDRNGMRKHPERSNFVVNNPLRKLTVRKVRRIKSMLKEGISLRDIARLFRVTHENIFAISKGKTWRDV